MLGMGGSQTAGQPHPQRTCPLTSVSRLIILDGFLSEDQVSIDRAKLLERLRAVKDKLPPAIAKELEAESAVTVATPSKKGLTMAALYLLGASYGQLSYLFGVDKSTVYGAVNRHLGPRLRRERPRHNNKPILTWEQVTGFRDAALRLVNETDAALMARKLTETKVEEDEDENDPYLRD